MDDFIKEYQERAKEAGTDPLGYYVPPLVYSTFQVLEQAVKGVCFRPASLRQVRFRDRRL
jgi:hypothetical protein